MTVLVWISLPILTPVSLIVMTLALQRWETALLPPATKDARSAGVIVEEFGRAPRVDDYGRPPRETSGGRPRSPDQQVGSPA